MVDFKKLETAWWALRIGLGLAAFLAGLDKYFNLLTNWEQYLNPLTQQLLPISAVAFMEIVGVIEMVVGLTILTGWTRIGAYVAMLWLLAIAGNLVMTGRYFDVAVRDIEMSIAAFTLARLTEVRATVAVKTQSRGMSTTLEQERRRATA